MICTRILLWLNIIFSANLRRTTSFEALQSASKYELCYLYTLWLITFFAQFLWVWTFMYLTWMSLTINDWFLSSCYVLTPLLLELRNYFGSLILFCNIYDVMHLLLLFLLICTHNYLGWRHFIMFQRGSDIAFSSTAYQLAYIKCF